MTRRIKARRFGLWSERLASALLRAKGYRILARGYRVRGGEIDIIARRGTTVIFVEVKARPTRDDALIAVTWQQQRRISRAASTWLATHPAEDVGSFRADAVFIAPWRWPIHLVAAFPLRDL